MQTNKHERPAAPRSTDAKPARAADRDLTAVRPARPRPRSRALLRALPFLAAGLLGAATMLAPREAAAQSKIAIIDLRRAMYETEEGLRMQATLKKLFDSRQVEIDTKQRALADERDKLDKEAKAGKTPNEALQRRYETLQRQAAELQSTVVDYQREMQRKENELTTPILQKVLDLVRRIAAQEGYEIVLDKAAAAYYRADLELTDRAIQMYNSGQTGSAAPAAPKGAPAAPPGKPGAPAPAPAPKPAAPAKK